MAADKINPPGGHAAPTPSDTVALENVVGVYVNVVGNVALRMGNTSLTYLAVPAGTTIPGQFTHILSTGTTASVFAQFEG
jgi:hypothetical protein